jgi:hypothetical protein
MNSGDNCGGERETPEAELVGSTPGAAFFTCAQERGRTSTPFRALEPEGSSTGWNHWVFRGFRAISGYQRPLAVHNSGDVPHNFRKPRKAEEKTECVCAGGGN